MTAAEQARWMAENAVEPYHGQTTIALALVDLAEAVRFHAILGAMFAPSPPTMEHLNLAVAEAKALAEQADP